MTNWALPWPVVFARLLGSILLCGLIGFERELSNRSAGLRTHMLVGLAAAVYTITTLYLVTAPDLFGDAIRMDPVRIIEAVTSGVAFLAAGLIVFAQGKVHGLTTGASMWLAASVGTAVGLGLWVIAIATTVMALVIIILLRHFEDRVMETSSEDPPTGG